MKKILFEQLPPELFSLFEAMSAELTELKRMIQEGEIGVAISEAEFNLVKERVQVLEAGLEALAGRVDSLNISPEQLNVLFNSIEGLTTKVGTLETQDRSTATMITAMTNRLTSLEMQNLHKGANALVLPATVTTNLTLPTSDEFSNTISWYSSNDDYIGHDGSVERPASSIGNVQVALTATLTAGANSIDKVFTLTVLAAELTDAERLSEIVSTFDDVIVGTREADSIRVTENQTLPTELNGTTVTWTSSNESVFSLDGQIVRSSEDVNVMVIATIRLNEEETTRTFNIIVAASEPELIDYTKLITSLAVTNTEDGVKATIVYDDLSDERLGDATGDTFVQLMTDIPDEEMIDITLTVDGSPVGTYPVTAATLKAGATVSTIMGEDVKLLTVNTSHDTDVLLIQVPARVEDLTFSIQYHINGISVKEGAATITGTPLVEPPTEEPVEPEPIEPEPEPTEPEPEPEPQEPTDEPKEPVDETPVEPVEEPSTEPTETE